MIDQVYDALRHEMRKVEDALWRIRDKQGLSAEDWRLADILYLQSQWLRIKNESDSALELISKVLKATIGNGKPDSNS